MVALSLFSFWLALSLYLSVSQAVSSLVPPFRGLVVVVGCGGSDFPSTSWPSFVERYPLSLSFFWRFGGGGKQGRSNGGKSERGKRSKPGCSMTYERISYFDGPTDPVGICKG